jgi:hypothetical protein
MFLWFVILSIAGVVTVFRDPRLDHRLVAVGAVIPDFIDGLVGLARNGRIGPPHTLIGAVGALTVTMAVTVGKRPLRKRLLALPIGWLAHLVLDGAWTDTKGFWWPAFGTRLGGRIPVLGRPMWVNIAMEVAAVGVGWWLWKRTGITDDVRRRAFWATGALELQPVVRPARRR